MARRQKAQCTRCGARLRHPSPACARSAAELTRLTGATVLITRNPRPPRKPSHPAVSQPSPFPSPRRSQPIPPKPPSKNQVLYTTIITEANLNRAGVDISVGTVYKFILAHFPVNETVWTKYLVEAVGSNVKVWGVMREILGVPDVDKVREGEYEDTRNKLSGNCIDE